MSAATGKLTHITKQLGQLKAAVKQTFGQALTSDDKQLVAEDLPLGIAPSSLLARNAEREAILQVQV